MPELPDLALDGRFASPTHSIHCAHEVQSASASHLETKQRAELRRPYDRIFRRPRPDGILAKDRTPPGHRPVDVRSHEGYSVSDPRDRSDCSLKQANPRRDGWGCSREEEIG